MGVIIRQSIKGTIANYIGVAVGFVTTFFILTNYLTAEEIGLTRVMVDAATIFSSLALLGTGSSTIRFYPYFKDEERNNNGLFFWTLIIPFVGFLLFLICFFVFKGLIIKTFIDKSPLFINYVYFVLPLSFFMLYISVFEVNATILTRIAIPKFIREVVIRVLLLCGYLLFGFDVIDLDGLVVFFCVTYGAAALINLFYLLFTQKVSFKPNFQFITKPLAKEFAWYTLFLVTLALVTSVMPTISSFFISAKMGLVYTGIFAIANYIATVIEIPYRSLSAAVQPRISLAIKENNISRADILCKKVSLHQFLAGCFILMLIWINVDLLFQILPNGEQYVAGKYVVFILSMQRLCNASFGIGVSVLSYTKYYYYSLIFSIILITCTIILNLILIPSYGIMGAALATFIAFLLYYALVLSYVKYKVGTLPICMEELKVLILIVALYFINLVVSQFTVSWCESYSLLIQIIEAGVRSCLILAIGVVATYFWKISPEVNSLIEKSLSFLKLKKD